MKGKNELRMPTSLHILRRKALAFALAFALMLSTMMTMISTLEVKAESSYQTYINECKTVKIDGVDDLDWYIIAADDTTVTLFPTKCIGASEFDENASNKYDKSTVKRYLNNELNNGRFASVKDAVSEFELLDTNKANNLLKQAQRKCDKASGATYNKWWLSSSSSTVYYAACVNGSNGSVDAGGSLVDEKLGVRPALTLDLSKVTFSSNTFTVGASQSHTHSWDIVASGATATLKCTSEDGDCSYTKDKEYKATISATSKAYDGTAVIASITKDEGFPSEITTGDISYVGRDDTNYTSSTTAPSVVGKYTASATVSDGTNSKTISVDYEITKATSGLTAAPTGATGLTFNGADRALLASSGTASGGTLYYRLGNDGEWKTTPPTATLAGDYVIYYYVKGDSSHSDYGSESEPSGSIEVSIAKKLIIFSGGQANDKEYDGTNVAIFSGSLAVSGLEPGYTMVGPVVNCVFEDSKPGNNKTVTVTYVKLIGRDKDNYIATYDTSETLTANITIADGSTLTDTVTQSDGTVIKTETTYKDNAPDTIVETTTSADGDTVTVQTKNSNGETTNTVETVKNADGSTTVTEKDASGNVTKETVTNADGTSTVTTTEGNTTTVETKDSEGNVTKKVETVDNGNGTTVTTTKGNTTTVETKDSEGNVTKTVETVDNGNGTTTVTTTEGNTTKVETKDSEGNVTKTVETVDNGNGTTTVTTTEGNTTTVETVDDSGETSSVIKQEANEQGTAVKAVEEIGDAPDTILNNDVDTLVDKLISDEEKARQQNGEIVKIILDVEDVTDTVEAGDKEKISSVLATDEKVGEYFDINLYKQIGTSARVQITDTNNQKISISMRIPDELLNHDDKVERTYHIVRLHEGTAELIDSTTDLTKQLITFETDKFSIYAITYIDKEIDTSADDNEQDDSNSDDASNDNTDTDAPSAGNNTDTDTPSTQTDKDNPSATPAEVKTPDTQADTGKTTTAAPNDNKGMSTGDKVNLAVVIMLMLDSAMAALYLSLRRRKM